MRDILFDMEGRSDGRKLDFDNGDGSNSTREFSFHVE